MPALKPAAESTAFAADVFAVMRENKEKGKKRVRGRRERGERKREERKKRERD